MPSWRRRRHGSPKDMRLHPQGALAAPDEPPPLESRGRGEAVGPGCR